MIHSGSHENDCPTKPVVYIRADLHERKIDEIVVRSAEMDDERLHRILMVQSENERLKAELDRLKAEIETPRERRGFS